MFLSNCWCFSLLSLSNLAFAHPAQAASIKFSTWNFYSDVSILDLERLYAY
jgi:hypothetical protein